MYSEGITGYFGGNLGDVLVTLDTYPRWKENLPSF